MSEFDILVEKRFSAPINNADLVEGTITDYDVDTGYVSLTTDEGEVFYGYEYQLENCEISD